MEKLTIIKVGGKIVEEEQSLKQLLADFAKIEGYKILTKGLTPIKFYNYYNKKATDIDRKKFLKETSAPSRYPKGTFIIPKMELE